MIAVTYFMLIVSAFYHFNCLVAYIKSYLILSYTVLKALPICQKGSVIDLNLSVWLSFTDTCSQDVKVKVK